MVKAFISYSSNDTSFADKLATDLNSLGAKIFYAKWEIKVGDSIVAKINEGLSSHEHLIIILSSSSVKSDWVKRELNSSLMRQLNQKGICIKPVLIEDCEIPPLLADIKYADFRKDYNYGLTDLINSFRDDFDLDPYLQLVEEVSKKENLFFDHRLLAFILKRVSPISNLRLNILSSLSKKNELNEAYFESKFGKDDFVLLQFDYLTKDGLVEIETLGGVNYYSITNLGRQILKIIIEGLNQGILSTVCSL